MTTAINKTEDGTINLNISIPWSEVEKTKKIVLEEHTKQAQVPGFRTGKAPTKLVEETVDEEHLREDVLRKLLPDFYLKALNEHQIKPVISPRIHVNKLEDNKDWEFTATTSEAPVVELGNYKENIRQITARSKIIIPGKEPQPVPFDDIVRELLASTTVKIPKIIIEQETERLLAQTLDEVKRLGLTLDQYLASTQRKIEDLKLEYEKKAENDIKLEFVLQKIAEAENITVEEKEITEAITQAKSDEERKSLEANKYLLSNILRQQKTLDFLKNL